MVRPRSGMNALEPGHEPAVLAAEILSEDALRTGVDLLVRLVEAAGALIIFFGAGIAAIRFVLSGLHPGRVHEFTGVRLSLGRYLALGLEFQLASDVLSTAIAPTYEEIGKLAAIATIRTLLNYFLRQELEAERSEQGQPP